MGDGNKTAPSSLTENDIQTFEKKGADKKAAKKTKTAKKPLKKPAKKPAKKPVARKKTPKTK